MLPQMRIAIKSFNSEVDKILKDLGVRCSKEKQQYHLYVKDGPFDPELLTKAQVMLRLGNANNVRKVKQEARAIDRCLGRANGKHMITVILDEGDLHVQSSTRSRGALEKEWMAELGPEGHAFMDSCFQAVNVTGTINAIALTSTSPITMNTGGPLHPVT